MKKFTFLLCFIMCLFMANAQVELVENGGFETGEISPWKSNGSSNSVARIATGADSHSGTYYAQYIPNGEEGYTSTQRLDQDVTVEVGKIYVFSFWYNNYDASNSNGLKNYSIQGTSGSNYIEGGTPAKLTVATEWTKYETTFTATESTIRISLRLYQNCDIDDISIMEVVDEQELDAPVAAEPTEVTSNSFQANWSSVTGAEGYKVRVYTKEGDVETEIDNSPFTVVEDNFLVIEGLESETQYFYTVTAFAEEGDIVSEPSGEMDVTTLAEIPTELATPEVSAATEVTHNSFQANWNVVEGAEGYYVKVYTKEGDEETEIANSPFEVVGENFRIIEGLDSETEYFYTVAAFNTDLDLESAESTEMNVTTLTEPDPSAPTLSIEDAEGPVEGPLNFFALPNSAPQMRIIGVMGENLTENITLTLDGTDEAKGMFEVLPNPIIINGDGTVLEFVTITYQPTAAGTHEVTLVISTAGIEDIEIDLIGTTETPTPSLTVEDEDGAIEDPIEFFALPNLEPADKLIGITGENLTGETITFTLDGDDADKAMFEVPSPLTIGEDGSVNEFVTITYQPTAAGTHEVTLVISTNGIEDIEIELIGTSELEIPVATAATLVLADGFTANWEAVTDATEYELYVYTKEPTTGQGTELVENGGFETGEITPWISNGSANSVARIATGANAHSGTYYAQYIPNGEEGYTSTQRLDQDITVEVGKTYIFSFWYNNYDASNTNGLKNYSIQGTSGTSYIEGGTPAKLAAATEWTKYETTFTATESTIRISLRLYQNCDIDDISLVEVPEVLTPITGSPFTGITATSYKVEGLEQETEYFYTVKATVEKNGNSYETELSNEIKVTTIAMVPTITVKESSVPNMTAVVGATDTKTIHVSGVYLEGDITLALEGTNAGMFSLSKTTLVEKDGVVAEEAIVITYEPNAAGSHTATLRITSEDATEVTFTLNGTATEQGGTNLPEYADNFIIYTANGQVHFETEGGLAVEVYNTVGQPIYRGVSVEGLNSIPADGVIIIRVGNTVNKVIVK